MKAYLDEFAELAGADELITAHSSPTIEQRLRFRRPPRRRHTFAGDPDGRATPNSPANVSRRFRCSDAMRATSSTVFQLRAVPAASLGESIHGDRQLRATHPVGEVQVDLRPDDRQRLLGRTRTRRTPCSAADRRRRQEDHVDLAPGSGASGNGLAAIDVGPLLRRSHDRSVSAARSPHGSPRRARRPPPRGRASVQATRLPLWMYVRTSTNPTSAAISRSRAIGSLLWPPTLMPRNRAMTVVEALVITRVWRSSASARRTGRMRQSRQGTDRRGTPE